MDLEALALAVDEHAFSASGGRAPARLFGVRLAGAEVVLDLLAEGEPRRIPGRVRPPAGLAAVALAMTAWAAPMAEDGAMTHRPSRHPRRRSVHVTELIAGDDCADVSVLRYADGEPVVVRGAVGAVHDRLVRCWARRSTEVSPR